MVSKNASNKTLFCQGHWMRSLNEQNNEFYLFSALEPLPFGVCNTVLKFLIVQTIQSTHKMGYSQTETEKIETDAFAANSLQSPRWEKVSKRLIRHPEPNIENLRHPINCMFLSVQKSSDGEFTKRFSTVSDILQSCPLYEDPASTALSVNKNQLRWYTGTKYKDLEPMPNLDVPPNLALEPTSLFGLRNAVLGAQNWHEIVLDIRNSIICSRCTLCNLSFIINNVPIDTMNVISRQIPKLSL